MGKRPRCLLGLGALIISQGSLSEGFVFPSPSRVRLEIHKTPGKHEYAHRKSNGAPSTWILFAAEGQGAGEEEGGGFVSNETSQRSSISDDSLKRNAASPPADSIPADEMSLSQLLKELDKRDIRYAPSATRLELERLLQNTQRKEEKPTISKQSSLQELIRALDARDIRYPPTASRKELQALLDSSPSANAAKPQSTPNDIHIKKGESNGTAPLAQILEELDRQNIRYPPTASRMQLEELLRRATTTEKKKRTTAPATFTGIDSVSSQRSSRGRIRERDERKSRQDYVRREAEVPRDTSPTAAASSSPTSSSRSRRMPLNTLLAELDKLNVRYAPTASRVELEELLKQSLEQRALHQERRQRRRREKEAMEDSSSPGIKDLLQKSTRVASKAVKKIPQKVSKIASSPQVTSRIDQVADSAKRRAKRVSRRASEFWNVDEDGIRDVDFQYVSVDRTIDVPAVPMDEEEGRRASQSGGPQQRRPRRSPRSSEPRTGSPPPRARQQRSAVDPPDPNRQWDNRVRKQRRPRSVSSSTGRPSSDWQPDNRVPPRRQRQKRPVSRQKVEESLGSSSFMLPPTSTTETQSTTVSDRSTSNERSRRTRDSQRNGRKKKVYSSYVYDEDGEIEGPFDIIGDFLTNSADRLLWGPEGEGDDDGGRGQQRARDDTERRRSDDGGQDQQRARADTDRRRKHADDIGKEERKPRYWKDRLAEQIDFALGIHEDGKYYNSWEKQLDEDQERIEREGPEFWESSPPRKRRPTKGSVKYRSPFWKEDGSMMSFILGRTKTGEKLSVERFMDRAAGDDRMVTTFFNTALRSLLLVSTYVCRWASVRGAVPQPIVVMGVTSAFLCARPGYRLRTMVLALVSLRGVGELIHSYSRGDADWEENYSEEDDSSNRDSQSSDHPSRGE